MTSKPKRSSVASALDALDFITESQQMQSELRVFVKQLLPLLDTVHKLCTGLDGLTPEQLAGKASALALLPEVADAAQEAIGLVRFGTAGGSIDSRRHEVVETKPDPKAKNGTVLDVIEPGWELDGNVLRPARVVAVNNTAD